MKSRNSKKTPKKVPLPPVSLGITVMENLPFPFVHYPNHYGTFIAFSKDNDSTPSHTNEKRWVGGWRTGTRKKIGILT